MKRYERLVDDLTRLIRSQVLRPGDRMPSVRKLGASHAVSPGTVLKAYGLMEDAGLIEARPRSGYYVAAPARPLLPAPEAHRPEQGSTPVDVIGVVVRVLASVKDRTVVPLGSAFPSPMLFPLHALARAFAAAARHLDPWQTVSDLSPGNAELRRLISHRYLETGCAIAPDDIVITSGALEALNLCLQTVTRPGDLVAVESPAFYAALQSIEMLGLRAVEIPTHPADGVDLNALESALTRHPIKACWFMTTFQNPLGGLMPENNKRRLVELLARHEVPLIEDDVYAELYLRDERPKPAKAFDSAGLVMHCSSFSKSLAPGFRVGWVAAGRYSQAVEQRKLLSSLSASVPSQMAVTEYLKQGGYERHLRQLRRTLAIQQDQMLGAIAAHFPDGCRVTCPDGGYFLWVELAVGTDALEVHRRAMEAGISVSPGPMFSARGGFRNCLRLNYGHPWTDPLEQAVRSLADIVTEEAATNPRYSGQA